MPYQVANINELWDDAKPVEERTNDVVSEFLDEQEREGWSLVGVAPDYRMWDSSGEDQIGVGPAMLILHKP